jgi:hypothetical protein
MILEQYVPEVRNAHGLALDEFSEKGEFNVIEHRQECGTIQ